MVSRNAFQWNLAYIQAVNKCDRQTFLQLFHDAMEMELKGLFIRKRYIWNWIRGKDFYKNLAYYVVQQVKDALGDGSCNRDTILERVEKLIHEVLASEKRHDVRKSFIWNITKQVPLITIDTIGYMSEERVTNMLRSDKSILCDAAFGPFIKELIDLKGKLKDAEEVIDAMTITNQ